MTKIKREDYPTTGPIDVEQQFILRLPEAAGVNMGNDLQNGTFRDKLSIEIHPELRKGKVVYGGQMFNAKLFDLPCIVESYKTTDKKTFYKTADVSQILICTTEFEEENTAEEETTKKKDKDKKFNYQNGLCPPFKCVRRKRFRKIVHKKNPEQPDIDRELRRLFATDAQAIDFKWEVIEGEEESHHGSTTNQNKNKSAGGAKEPSESAKASYSGGMLGTDSNSRIECSEGTTFLPSVDEESLPNNGGSATRENGNNHIDIFGEVSSSEDDGEGGLDTSMEQEGQAVSNGGRQLDQTEDQSRDNFESF